MYKPAKPIRCPKCGTTVNVNTSMILTTNPPCYEWTCPNCGEKGYTKQGDIITFENQTKQATLPYIQKVDEPDTKSTACDIPAPKFIQQGWECPKCGAILAPYQSYCPFCSPSEYGRTNWLGTNTPTSGQYTNQNINTAISFGDKLKTPVSDNIIFTTSCEKE